MLTTTKFTNNVLRAKAVKLLTPKRGSDPKNRPGSKFTNKVIMAKPPAINDYPGQTVPGIKRATLTPTGGPGAQMKTPPKLTPKTVGY